MFERKFDIEDKREENKNRSIGLVTTVVIHALLGLFLIFVYLNPLDPPLLDNAGGMTVNYGTADVGGDEQQQYTNVPVDVKPMDNASPSTPPDASKAPEDMETQNTEEAPAVETKPVVKKKIQKTNPDAILKPKPSKTTAPVEAPKPAVDANALFKPGATGKANNSKGDGGGAQTGDRGKRDGDPGSRNYEGDGGPGNTPGHGGGDVGLPGNVKLAGRRIKGKPKFSYDCDARGKVVMNIKVNKNGRVVGAEFTQSGSTTADDCLINRAKQLASQYSFDEGSNEGDQVGSISFDFRER